MAHERHGDAGAGAEEDSCCIRGGQAVKEDGVKEKLRKYMKENREKAESGELGIEKAQWETWIFGAIDFAVNSELIDFDTYLELLDEYEAENENNGTRSV